MTRLAMVTSRTQQQCSVLRKYLRLNGISHRLAMRIQRNALHSLSDQQFFLPEASVDLLQVVSEPLRVELHYEVYLPMFAPHPFFACYSEECPQVMRGVCHRAMSMAIVSRGDVVFYTGEIPANPKMFMVCTGVLKYTGAVTRSVVEKEWISEACLWTEWIHRGELVAHKDCRLGLLDAQSFQHTVSQFHRQSFDVKAYAEEFVNELNSQMPNISDLMDDMGEDEDGRKTGVKRPSVKREKTLVKTPISSFIKKNTKKLLPVSPSLTPSHSSNLRTGSTSTDTTKGAARK